MNGILLSSICLEAGTDIQLALYYLKSYVLKFLPSREIQIQVFTEDRPVAYIVKKIAASGAGLIGFSCYLWNIENTLAVCRKLKKINPRLKIVLGGPEVSPRAQEILENTPAVDIIVKGEGEEAFLKAVGAPENFRGVLSQPPLRDINAIPSPYLSGLVDLKDKNIVDIPLETTRGCRFRCGYCYYHKNFPQIRYFSLKRVEKELKLILAGKPHEVYLMDATFNAEPRRAKEILRLFIKYNRGSNLHVELKTELVDDEMARLLSRANAHNIEIGLQSTNSRTLKACNRGFDKEKFRRGVRLLNKYGLYYEIQLIDALPHQRYKDLMVSLDWLYSLHPAKVVIFRFAVLPGTILRERAAEYGIVFGPKPPYYAKKSSSMSEEEISKIEKISYAMDRLYDSQVFQKTLFAFKRRAKVKISTILEDWTEWEAKFKRHPADYPEFLNKKSPMFLQYICRKHGQSSLYEAFLSSLLKA